MFWLSQSLVLGLSPCEIFHQRLNFTDLSRHTVQQASLPLPLPAQTHYPLREEVGGRIAPRPTNLSAIPRNAADLMFNNYVDIQLRRHECVDQMEITESYTTCFDTPERASSYAIFIVCMELAISAATLVWKNEKHALSTSAGFFTKAKEMLAHSTTCSTEIQQIQVALLLTHYSFTSPTAADPWYCVSLPSSEYCPWFWVDSGR